MKSSGFLADQNQNGVLVRELSADVAIGWHGLPIYAARQIASAGGAFPVIATRPAVPAVGMEEILGPRLHWIEAEEELSWGQLGLKVPRIFFQPSWFNRAYNSLGSEVYRSGGMVVLMFDNRWKGNLRQVLAAAAFRTIWRRKYTVAWVPGLSSRKLALFWGFRAERVFQGMYTADHSVFGALHSMPVAGRKKRIIFVGRFVEEKGIRLLCDAWARISDFTDGWQLDLYGAGDLALVTNSPRLGVHPFQAPEVIASEMKSSRFLVLPSFDEHWGLVVCEAAQSGCGLLLSRAVGSRFEFQSSANGYCFREKDAGSLCNALKWAVAVSDQEFAKMSSESIRRGAAFTPGLWTTQFNEILKLCSAEIDKDGKL